MRLPFARGNRVFVSHLFVWAVVGLQLVTIPELAESTPLRQFMIWVGYVLVVAGVLGRIYASLFIAGRKNEELVRGGPYSVVRNPLYLCSLLATLGIGLESGMLTIFALLAGAFIVYYPIVVWSEEQQLAKKLGTEFAKYRAEVPRWLPAFRQWNEPDQLAVHPKLFRRTIMDAAVFFVPLPCYFLIEHLHAMHLLPRWLSLP